MWRSLSRQASLKKLRVTADSYSCLSPSTSLLQDSIFNGKIQHQEHQICSNLPSPVANSKIGGFGLYPRNGQMGMLNSSYSGNAFGFSRYFGSAAEALVSTEEEEDSDEAEELIKESKKVVVAESRVQRQGKQQKLVGGMGQGKYTMLRRRQVKIETEAWHEAAKEYQELLTDMCEQKLAPNLPYMKTLFLGWFEPLKNAIAAEQDFCKEGKNKPSHAPHFDQLPPDMMAVITMHKLMGLLMTGGGNGEARVVQAATQIGEAIEHEARIHRFLQKTKRNFALNKGAQEESNLEVKDQQKVEIKDQQKLRRRVTILMKKQKLQQVRGIVKAHDDAKPWGQEAQVKVYYL